MMALAYALFLIPHKIVPGGVGGVAIILNHFFNTPIGLVIVIVNVPLFIIGIRVLGRHYGVKSILGVVMFSALIDLFGYILPLGPATADPILACVFGGLLLGAGLGLVFRGGGSTGGVDIAAQILNRYTNLSTGTAMLIVDTVVIAGAGISFGSFELALYGCLSLYLQTRAVDLVLEGLSYTRAMFINSRAAAEIARAITTRMNRGATLLDATGAHTGSKRQVVFAVMAKRQVPRVRELVREIDPEAFVVITDVYEVLGEGFRPRT